MATYMPVSGSFSTYATRFVDPAFGFALGWNYWFNWAVTLAVEIAAAAIIMKFWLPDVPSLLWSALFLGLVFTLNALSIKSYGESEYWFALIKVVAIIFFIIIGLLTILGVFGGKVIGFENFTMGEAPFKGGFLSIISIFLIAGFSFQGTELVGIAAGKVRIRKKCSECDPPSILAHPIVLHRSHSDTRPLDSVYKSKFVERGCRKYFCKPFHACF